MVPRVPLSLHAAQLAVIWLGMVLVRVPWIASPLSQLLGSVLPADGFYVRRFAGGYYEELSSLDWLFHFALIPCGLEIVGAFRRLAAASSRRGQERQRRVYEIMSVIYVLSQVQASLTLTAHSLVNVNSELEVALMVIEFTLLRLNAFGTGILLLSERLGAPPPATFACGLVMLPLVLHDCFLFGNLPGIVSSSLSLVMVGANQHLPWPYKAAWAFLSTTPALLPASSNDLGHSMGTAGILIPICAMPCALCCYEEALRKKTAA